MLAIKSLLAGLVTISVCMAANIINPITLNISGTVTDTGGIPIQGATVYLEHFKDSATTQIDGSFTLGNTSSIKNQLTQTSQKPMASILRGFLYVNLLENSAIEIYTYNLQGKLLSAIQKTMAAGNQSVVLPQMGSGIYLYKVKLGKAEFLLKSNSVGEVSRGTAEFSQRVIGDKALGKKALIVSAISDVIGVTKEGYLNYEIAMTIPVDTSGIKIKMIVCADTVRDADGNLYHAVRIGNQVWTVENLRVTKFNDGTAITKIADSAAWYNIYKSNLTTPAFCYYNNMTIADSIKKWGALYNWYAVNTGKLAPAGWHVPTDAEWEVMQSYLVMHGYNYDGTTDTTNNKIAMALAAKTDWPSDTNTGAPGKNLPKNNSSGFSALPCGDRRSNFGGIGSVGYLWNATENYVCGLDYSSHNLYWLSWPACLPPNCPNISSFGFAVRLVRDK